MQEVRYLTGGAVDGEDRPNFRQLLRDARMSQSEFRSLVRRLCGRDVAATTTSRWVRSVRTAPPCAMALLILIGRLTPEELKRLL
jgi:hypothetical protein